jgi:predicted transcriptional regulator
MSTRSITIQLPEMLYARLQHMARATRRPLPEVLVHAVVVALLRWRGHAIPRAEALNA